MQSRLQGRLRLILRLSAPAGGAHRPPGQLEDPLMDPAINARDAMQLAWGRWGHGAGHGAFRGLNDPGASA
jgi:hypothetical protein